MLAEWLTYLRADCPPLVRKLGYLRESIGIRSRYRRCRMAWQPHLAHSRAALLDSLDACRDFRVALVFGSGLLLDIPLAELSRRFAQVWLVDLVHLPEVRRAARRHANVRCLSHDVTGFLERLDDVAPGCLDLPPPQRFLDVPEIGWVASVNLLSQLPLLPLDWLRRRFPECAAQQWEPWAEKLMRQHLDYLAAFGKPACLLADAEQTTCRADGEILGQEDFGGLLDGWGQPFSGWRWDIAPAGEIAPGIARHHRVTARASGGASRRME